MGSAHRRTLNARLCVVALIAAMLSALPASSALASQSAPGLTTRTGANLAVDAGSLQPMSVGEVVPDYHYFPETGHWLAHGFLRYWTQFGGLATFGFPISEEVVENGLTVQYFERARFEWHPGAWPDHYDVLLGLLGRDVAQHDNLLTTAPFQPITGANDANCNYYSETGHTLCFGFRDFWNNHGGLAIYGFPISQEFQMNGYTVQYFERQRLEYHPENAPPWDVEGGLLGAQVLANSGTVYPRVPPPTFASSISTVGADQQSAMLATGSWRSGCPVPISALRVLQLSYWGFDGAVHSGQMMVNADVAQPVVQAFQLIFTASFPVRRMELVENFNADDEQSMLADNTSAFNCRGVPGSTAWSEHAYGRAVDLNPFENPEVRNGAVDPPSAAVYTNRSLYVTGMIHPGDAAVQAFAAIGWSWGGDWTALKDYQHFSLTGN